MDQPNKAAHSCSSAGWQLLKCSGRSQHQLPRLLLCSQMRKRCMVTAAARHGSRHFDSMRAWLVQGLHLTRARSLQRLKLSARRAAPQS